jgi:hypothetical protein
MRLTFARSLGAVALVMSLALAAAGQQGGPKEGAPSRRAPVCRIVITPTGGVPAACALLAYENGAYLVRHPNGREYTLRATEVSAVKFMPLKGHKDERRPEDRQPPRDERHGRRDDDRRPPRGWPPDLRGRLSERLKSIEPRLRDMKRRGTLGAYIKDHERRLVDSKDPIVARQLLLELGMAHRVNGWAQGQDYWRKLTRSIKDEAVRRSLKRPGLVQPGPRRPWRR